MKITGPENLNQPIQVDAPSPKDADRAADFSNMLREALDHSDAPGSVQKSAPLSEPRIVQGYGDSSFQDAGLAEKASRAIDLLDAYANALSNPHKTLRDIEPELTAFVSEAQSLYDAYLETDRDDPQLDTIMEELLRTARLEGLRFQRGDYLDTQ